ncbi:MAG: hypothetical protein EOO73_23480 [Myxococcales bacterium]|nr:MAG: hypothetical protein EOO73_23480 [Myxococcales bacterium]
MPEKTTVDRAKRDRAEGKAASTQAGEFIREEMHHIREGKHGARNAKQAIAIGLSKARRAGFDAKPSPTASKAVRRKANQESEHANRKPNPRRARAAERALEKEPQAAASPAALSRHAKASAESRRKRGGPTSPRAVAQRAAKTRKKSASPRARAKPSSKRAPRKAA